MKSSQPTSSIFSRALLLLVHIIGILFALESWAVEVPFSASVAIEAPFGGASELASGDLDGDGDLDLVATAESADELAWFENTGSDFSAWIRHDLALNLNTVRGVALGDLDGDGDLDVTAAAVNSDSVRWWENDLNSGLTCGADFCPRNVGFLPGASDVVVAEIDGDGDLDLLAVGTLAGAVVWFENGGDGSTWSKRTIDSDVDQARRVFAADLDSDGDIDAIAGGDDGGPFAWWENDLSSGATCGSSWCRDGIGGGGLDGISAGDLDGDGDLDLVQGTGGGISWWQNTEGDGSVWTRVAIGTGGARGALAEDLDGDGDLDVLGSNNGDWFENSTGDGTAWTRHSLGIGSNFRNIVASDFDQDGDLDLAATQAGSDSRVIGRENQTLHRSAIFPIKHRIAGFAEEAVGIYSADIDGDGDVDLLAAEFVTDSIAWWENDGSACDPQCSWTRHSVDTAFDGARAVSAADVDGDGDLDILGAADEDDDISWWENDGSACTPTCTWPEHTVEGDFEGAFSVQAIDLDDDGDMDIVAAGLGKDVTWWENDGTICGASCTWPERRLSGGFIDLRSVDTADIDGDGDRDILAVASNAAVVWWENLGSPCGATCSWPVRVVDGSFTGGWAGKALDMDSDGDVDILASSSDLGISWWENDGTACTPACTWPKHNVDSSAGMVSVFASDLDADGDIDVLGGQDNPGQVLWWENDGSICNPNCSWPEHVVATSVETQGVRASDLDGDGDVDILAGAAGPSRQLSWWENRGGQFALPTTDAVVATTENEGASDVPFLRIDAVHRGRTGDANAELVTLELLFKETSGLPLTSTQLDSLAASFHLYLDDGDELFDPILDPSFFTLDPPFSLVEGVLTVTMPDDDASLQIAFGSDVTWWLGADLESDAGASGIQGFRVTHLTSASSSGEAAPFDLPISLEYQVDVSSQVVEINAAPDLVMPIADQVAIEDVPFELDVSSNFDDPEGQSVTFEAMGLPVTWTIDSGGRITGLPSAGDVAGSPYEVTVTATDTLGASATGTLTVIVKPRLLFSDGFESGDTNSWSLTFP